MNNFNPMIEIFITDIRDNIQAEKISGLIQSPGLRACFDLDETGLPFPCGHTILKVEGTEINAGEIMRAVKEQGFNCDILEDKICIQKEKS